MTFWVDISQVIGGFATAGALIFVGFQFIQTRKQTRIMQGRGWIGTEETGIAINDTGMIIRCRNYGNVPSRLLRIKFLQTTLEAAFPSHTDIEKSGKSIGQNIYVFPDKEKEFLIPALGRYSRVGIRIDYDDIYGTKGEYGLILVLLESNQFSKTEEWFN